MSQNNDFEFDFNGESAPQKKSKKKKTKRPNRFLRFLLTLFWAMVLVAASLFLSYFALSSASDLLGINQVDEQIEITIPENAKGDISEVRSILYDAGVIDQPLTFHLYAMLRHMDGSDRGEGKSPRMFQPGTYVGNSRWGYDNLMNYLSVVKTEGTELDVVTVTFKEGMTIKQIAEKLEENKVCSAKDFYDALNAEYANGFLERIPEDERFRRLEGYIFPDTYEFFVDMKPENVVKKFLNNVMQETLEPIRIRRKELEKDIPAIYDVLKKGSETAREVAAQTLSEVKSAMRINYFDDAELIRAQSEKYEAK